MKKKKELFRHPRHHKSSPMVSRNMFKLILEQSKTDEEEDFLNPAKVPSEAIKARYIPQEVRNTNSV